MIEPLVFRLGLIEIVAIPLTRGFSTIIDAGDWPLVQDFSWHARLCGKRWYACAKTSAAEGGKTLYMHRLIMAAEAHQEVDHEDGDGLMNRGNLRFCTRSQNNANRRSPTSARSGFRGVYQNQNGSWYGRVKCDGICHFTKPFSAPADAAAARDALAQTLFGDFATREAQR